MSFGFLRGGPWRGAGRARIYTQMCMQTHAHTRTPHTRTHMHTHAQVSLEALEGLVRPDSSLRHLRVIAFDHTILSGYPAQTTPRVSRPQNPPPLHTSHSQSRAMAPNAPTAPTAACPASPGLQPVRIAEDLACGDAGQVTCRLGGLSRVAEDLQIREEHGPVGETRENAVRGVEGLLRVLKRQAPHCRCFFDLQ